MASLSGKVQICNTTLYPFQRTLREYRVQPETPIETLWTQLRLARLDDYQRRTAKTSRAYPRKKRPLHHNRLAWLRAVGGKDNESGARSVPQAPTHFGSSTSNRGGG